MNVKELRDDAERIARYMPKDTVAWRVATGFLRILDAFDAMERERWALSQPAGDGLWHVLNEGGESIADDEGPLVAMLKATATLEGKSDES